MKEKTPYESEKLEGILISDETIHDVEQSISNQYIKEHLDYINRLIRLNISYPYRVRKMSIEGKVLISFVIKLDGSVKDVKIKKSSGFSILDNNAKRSVRKASPFPPPPVDAEIVISIIYKLDAYGL